MNTAVYPGSFDPTTNGHLDIIERASKFVDRLIVGVLENPSKNPLFAIDDRVEQLKELTAHLPNVEVISFKGLLIEFAKSVDAKLIIRGLRAVTDFEYEFQMALTNRQLDEELETLFISTSTQFLFLSSSMVKEVAMFGGSVQGMVPDIIRKALEKKYNKQEG